MVRGTCAFTRFPLTGIAPSHELNARGPGVGFESMRPPSVGYTPMPCQRVGDGTLRIRRPDPLAGCPTPGSPWPCRPSLHPARVRHPARDGRSPGRLLDGTWPPAARDTELCLLPRWRPPRPPVFLTG